MGQVLYIYLVNTARSLETKKDSSLKVFMSPEHEIILNYE